MCCTYLPARAQGARARRFLGGNGGDDRRQSWRADGASGGAAAFSPWACARLLERVELGAHEQVVRCHPVAECDAALEIEDLPRQQSRG